MQPGPRGDMYMYTSSPHQAAPGNTIAKQNSHKDWSVANGFTGRGQGNGEANLSTPYSGDVEGAKGETGTQGGGRIVVF